ncbi:membrane protein [Caminibacter profundus]
MHRYEELEKLYYKRLIWKFFILILLFVFFVLIGFYSYSKKGKKIQANEENITMFKERTLKEKKEIKSVEVNKSIKMDNKINKSNDKLVFVLPQIKEKDITESIHQKNIQNVKKENKLNKVSKDIKNTSIVVIKEKKVNIKELIQKYKEQPNYEIAMIIAKKYFDKDLKKSQLWALKANNLDPKREESWLLFADILLKENKKQKAIEILNIYLDTYGENSKVMAKIRSINE